MSARTYYVYIMASVSRALYVGVTNNLQRRVWEHKTKRVPGFTSKYNITRLVHFEPTGNVWAALTREKQVKAWSREKKFALIEAANPAWQDLSAEWMKGAEAKP